MIKDSRFAVVSGCVCLPRSGINVALNKSKCRTTAGDGFFLHSAADAVGQNCMAKMLTSTAVRRDDRFSRDLTTANLVGL